MDPDLLCLFCLGLCCVYVIGAQSDSLPKPSLSARPSSKVTLGDNVTLICEGPPRGMKFALYKDGEKTPVSTSEPTQHGAEFPLIHMNINQTGKYRCSYLLGRESPVQAPLSDSLELMIQEEQNESLLTRVTETKSILITALSCASILFLFFAFTQTVISHGETSRRFPRCLCCTWLVCFSSKSGAPQDETEDARVAKYRHSRTSVPETEDPEELIYIQLNLEALKEQQKAPGKMCPDPTIYATLALQ